MSPLLPLLPYTVKLLLKVCRHGHDRGAEPGRTGVSCPSASTTRAASPSDEPVDRVPNERWRVRAGERTGHRRRGVRGVEGGRGGVLGLVRGGVHHARLVGTGERGQGRRLEVLPPGVHAGFGRVVGGQALPVVPARVERWMDCATMTLDSIRMTNATMSDTIRAMPSSSLNRSSKVSVLHGPTRVQHGGIALVTSQRSAKGLGLRIARGISGVLLDGSRNSGRPSLRVLRGSSRATVCESHRDQLFQALTETGRHLCAQPERHERNDEGDRFEHGREHRTGTRPGRG